MVGCVSRTVGSRERKRPKTDDELPPFMMTKLVAPARGHYGNIHTSVTHCTTTTETENTLTALFQTIKTEREKREYGYRYEHIIHS